MNTLLVAIAFSMTQVATAFAGESGFDFRCVEVKSMIDLMTEGPDAVIDQASDDPVTYRDKTIPGWTCLMTPLPPMRNGRVYLQSLDCYAENGAKTVDERDFTNAGEIFKKNLAAFYKCFRDDLMNETPVSYMGTSRGEGIRGMLKSAYHGRHILVTYGYVRNSSPITPIVWQTVVGYSRE